MGRHSESFQGGTPIINKDRMNLFEIEKEFLPKKVAGMSYSEIRNELTQRGVDEEGVRIVIRSIDNKILSGEYSKTANSKKSAFFWIGLVVFLLGLFLTLGTYTGVINTGNSYIVAFGPLLGGLFLMSSGTIRSKKF